MITRTFHTKFWTDEFVVTLDRATRYIFNFLITNDRVNLTGIYEMSDRDIKFHAQITQEELDRAKDILSKANKIIFYKGWVKLVNANKYNSFSGPTQVKGKDRELALIPKELLTNEPITDTSIPTSTNTSIYTPITLHNITSSNTGGVGGDEKDSDSNQTTRQTPAGTSRTKAMYDGLTLSEVGERVLEAYKKFKVGSFKSFDSFAKNLEYWLKSYTPVEIGCAIQAMSQDNYWGPIIKGNKELIFNKKNPRGENVDYIGKFLYVYQKTHEQRSNIGSTE